MTRRTRCSCTRIRRGPNPWGPPAPALGLRVGPLLLLAGTAVVGRLGEKEAEDQEKEEGSSRHRAGASPRMRAMTTGVTRFRCTSGKR